MWSMNLIDRFRAELREGGARGLVRFMGTNALWITKSLVGVVYYRLSAPHSLDIPDLDPISVLEELRPLKFGTIDMFRADPRDFGAYLRIADYPRGVYFRNQLEKYFEHYLSLKLLELRSDDVYADIASFRSPFPSVVQRLVGCKVLRQDICYPSGWNGDRIGGNAAAMPIESNSITKMALHCSFEHFEGNNDTDFVIEARRVLRTGGRLCIVPLYMNQTYYILTNPMLSRRDLQFDPHARVLVSFQYKNRFGRHYDAEHLKRRVLDHCDGMDVRIICIRNTEAISPGIYARFALLLEKR